jgi:glycosyltransferase involved in cell wall biosynthesis
MIRMMDDLLGRFKFTSIADYLQLPVPAMLPDKAPGAEAHSPAFNQREPRGCQSISVIVPCFNEEEGISFLASNLKSLKVELQPEYDAEFVLVDDGSTDQTWTLLQKTFADNPNARLIRHERNAGVSAAIMTGLQQSRDIACSIDCDCSYDPSELRPMLRLMTSDVDLVTASPYHPLGAVLNVPGWRLLLSRASSSLYRLVTGCNLYTFTACVRVYRRSSTVDTPLQYAGFLGVAELLSKMALENKKIVEHPATLEVRIFGQSKMKVIRTILGHLRLLAELARLRFSTRLHDDARAVKGVHFPVSEPAKAEAEKS